MDRLVAELAVAGEIKSTWFDIEKESVWLAKEGKQVFIPRWYDMILKATKFKGRHVKRKDQIQFFMTDLAQSFLPDEEEDRS